ncbi:hypothetical protein AGABI1DRAFT_102278 [Agaricus bisporus var. burnettii JB137-S8]|uniref:C3H1-type domain-containing protein n=1 Tax=Agaricus bisporus var. burnettii (strain JB137-S8 / ATCC MYA-4627 / FGSC 10392) TaxID=597362 RepID=K5WZW3_AGABU|nr:uncharacterized protein AGABI1DRAFT_102278 [Agaricus bisporus var. burnettii JB137-S8]EKM76403.1 hypothetical protein AGABI1DRAFT_102278 [Agaricus bisporus var. burnettii JB137-S8]
MTKRGKLEDSALHAQESETHFTEISGFAMVPGPPGRRSASPHTPITRRDAGSRRQPPPSSQTQHTEDIGSQPLRRGIDLHPSLLNQVEAYSRGEASYARVLNRGGAYIERQELTDVQKDQLFVEYSEAIDGTDRRKEEVRIHGGGGGGIAQREEAADRQDWGEVERRTVGANDRPKDERWPWARAEEGVSDPNPSQQATHDILELFNEDLNLAERRIRAAPGAPKNFPASEWRNILRGRSVDLNRVLASQYISRPVSENVARLGDLEIRIPGKEKVKRVETSSDWIIAWGATAEATAFAFPHRQTELTQYTNYMLQKFRRRGSAHHARVILFDEALRETVGGGENCSLLDPELRENFTESILHPDGVDYHAASRNGERGLCNNFNSKNGCSNTHCTYQHKCKRCKEEGHGQSSCGKARIADERSKT